MPGEIVPKHEFYSYEAKYLDPAGAELLLPAPLDDAQTREVQALSLRAFEALELEGLARVDFFLEKGTGRWFVNEVNTIPGSMAAYLWIDPPISRTTLFNDLVEEALTTPPRAFSIAGADGTALRNAGTIASKLG